MCSGNGKVFFVFEKVYVHRPVFFFLALPFLIFSLKDKTYISSRSRAFLC